MKQTNKKKETYKQVTKNNKQTKQSKWGQLAQQHTLHSTTDSQK